MEEALPTTLFILAMISLAAVTLVGVLFVMTPL